MLDSITKEKHEQGALQKRTGYITNRTAKTRESGNMICVSRSKYRLFNIFQPDRNIDRP